MKGVRHVIAQGKPGEFSMTDDIKNAVQWERMKQTRQRCNLDHLGSWSGHIHDGMGPLFFSLSGK